MKMVKCKSCGSTTIQEDDSIPFQCSNPYCGSEPQKPEVTRSLTTDGKIDLIKLLESDLQLTREFIMSLLNKCEIPLTLWNGMPLTVKERMTLMMAFEQLWGTQYSKRAK